MITTARQLKDLIRNLSKKKSADAQILMRNYMMERFLERIALSDYKDRFILKGGMLVAAMVGLDARATMAVWARSLSGGSLYGQSPQALFYHAPDARLCKEIRPETVLLLLQTVGHEKEERPGP